MNDTINKIWKYMAMLHVEQLKSSEIYSGIGTDVSLVTVKRHLTEMVESGILEVYGKGRSTKYTLTTYGIFHAPIDEKEYFALSEKERKGRRDYNFSLIHDLASLHILSREELLRLEGASKGYKQKVSTLSKSIEKKELERFVIELSWKSSKIEGNTYTLLDTEKLIKEGVEAPGHSKEESVMILNHKKAFEYCLDLRHEKTITKDQIYTLHDYLIKGLGVKSGLRNSPVGITGSSYLPIDIPQTIEEEFDRFVVLLNKLNSSYERALMAVAGISYLQPFEDGNKRTARLLANTLLLMEGNAPLSYRNVDEESYRNALLVFYEKNSIEILKKIFIDQYLFSCEYYNINST
ncbi:MAG: Fic family protein [Candidatus Paceibacterota bacterium]